MTAPEYRSGQIYFVGYAFDEALDVLWQPLKGEFIQGKAWEAEIRVPTDEPDQQQTRTLIFRALADPSVRMRFRLDNGQNLVCAIRSIEELENGSIRISSPDLENT